MSLATGAQSNAIGNDGLPVARRRIVMLCLLAFSAMGILSISLVTVALPSIALDLGVAESSTVWLVSSYQLAVAASMLTFSGLGSMMGFRPVYIGGVTVFTVASLACVVAASLPTLIAMRFVQGLGAAAAMCVTPALFRVIYPQRMLGHALGLNALVAATAMAVGPTLGGLLVAHASWSWLFVVNVPIGLAILPALNRNLPPVDPSSRSFDVGGAVSSALGVTLLVLATNQLGNARSPGAGLLLLSGAGVAAWAFVVIQGRARVPLMPPELLLNQRLRLATIASVFANVGQGVALISMPFLFQGLYGFSVLKSGLILTAMPLAIMVAAPVSGRLADRLGSAGLASAGLFAVALSLASLASLNPTSAGIESIVAHVFVCGLGFGLFQTPNNREFISSVDAPNLGHASGLLTFSRNIGLTLGATLVSGAMALYAHPTVSGDAASEVHRHCLWAAAAASFVATGVSAWRLRRLAIQLP